MTAAEPTHRSAVVLTDDVSRTVYSTDNSIYQLVPEAIALPASVAELQHVLQDNWALAAPRAIAARGGGTGTNGQSLTASTMVDLKRNLSKLISFDVDARTAIVEPGIVTAQLNEQLADHGLFWAPHTSTLNRATVGGMISTDAAGKGSLIHGRAHRHVLRLKVLLADGTPWVAEPITIAEAEARAAGEGAGAALWARLLALAIDETTTFALPELARGFSGYGIDRLRRIDDSCGADEQRVIIDPTALLCGAEGTLAIITQATLRLTPLPTRPVLAVASYDSFHDALTDAVRLRETGPSAIESFDETTLERGKSSPAWPALGAVVGDHRGAVLLLEYTDEAPDAAGASIGEITAGGLARIVGLVDDRAEQASIWKVRADAVGLLAKVATGGPQMSQRPTAFVEDCAVPVAAMATFIAEFRQLLDDAGVVYGMFGHADVGCVHVRPALDLTHASQREKLAELTRDVTALVNRHGGLLWGEHGRGFRGESITDVLDAETLRLMRSVKSAFDPQDLLNPGKLYRPLESTEALVAVAEAPMRGARDETIDLSVRNDFAHAFACNGNGLCHHYGDAEVMCPSYKATGDPALSPKGRADLLREWLRARRGDAEFEDALAANLDECLSCSACTGHCPVEVDIAELKSRFFDAYYRQRRRPVSHRIMTYFEQLAATAARFPRLAALGVGPAGRALGLVDLPAPKQSANKHAAFDPADSGLVEIVILPDVFTSALEANTLSSAVDLLSELGYAVRVAPFVGSGKFDHVKGQRARFAKVAQRHGEIVRSVIAAGATPVVIEPAVALLHQHEYPQQISDYPAHAVRSLPDMILDRLDQLDAIGDGAEVALLGHCTERATAPDMLQGWKQVLEAAGYSVAVPNIGCCGMAGVFGHEQANQAMSRTLWDRSWAPEMRGDRLAVATGYSCRSQAARFGDQPIEHPLALLVRSRSSR